MPELEVVCPSGFVGRVRGWKTKEANVLGSKRDVRDRTTFDKVLGACWLETTSPGPYAFENGKPDWSKVLLCDRFWTLLRMRAATFGDGYEFRVQCQDRALCGRRIEWECALSELPCKPLPDESRAKIASGDNHFTVELRHGAAAGKRAVFHLQTGANERKVAAMLAGQDARLVVTALAARIDEIEGVPKEGLTRFLDDLEMADLLGMMDQFDEADGGTETTIEIECPHCGLLQDVELPFGQDFFLPRRRASSATSGLLGPL